MFELAPPLSEQTGGAINRSVFSGYAYKIVGTDKMGGVFGALGNNCFQLAATVLDLAIQNPDLTYELHDHNGAVSGDDIREWAISYARSSRHRIL